MQPKIEERIHAEDYNNYVKHIQFDNVTISPLGRIDIEGFVNHEKEDYFVFTLDLNVEKATDYSFSNSLAKKMGNFDKESPAPLPSEQTSNNTQTKLSTPEERQAYLKSLKGLNLSDL